MLRQYRIFEKDKDYSVEKAELAEYIEYSRRHTHTNAHFLWSLSKHVLLTLLDIYDGCEAGCKGQLFHVNLPHNSHSICQCVIKIKEHQEDSQFPSDTFSQKHTYTFTPSRVHLSR